MLNPRVLDTTVASLLLDKNPQLAPYQPLLENATLILSFQTIAEMRFGALRAHWGEPRKHNLEEFFSAFQILEYADDLATHWAEIMYEARRVGSRLEAGDAWVAATARYLGAPLLTHDKDFSVEACPSITVYRFVP